MNGSTFHKAPWISSFCEPSHLDRSMAGRFPSASSKSLLQVRQGSLYPALHPLERRGWIKARWAASENNRQAKFYELTGSGRKQLEAEADAWRKLTATVAQALETA